MTSAASVRTRALAVAAAACAILTLGLTWGAASDGFRLPDWYVPGFCHNVSDWDGYLVTTCDPSTWYFGMTLPGSSGAVGAQTAARVFVVFVALAAALAWRLGSRRWAQAAMVAAGSGLLLSGLGARPGQLTYLAGSILLAFALHRSGLLGKSPSTTSDIARRT